MLARAHADLKDSDRGCAHVRYADLVADPAKVVKQLYADFGWEYTETYDATLRAYLARSNAKRNAEAEGRAARKTGDAAGHGAHTYSLEEYGLDEAALRQRLSWYYDEYL